MKCPACNVEVVATAQFCHKCGAKLSSAESPASAAIGEPDVAGLSPAARMRPRNIRDVPEEVLWEGGYSPRAMIGTWTAAGVVSVLLVGAAVVMSFGATPLFWIPLVVAGLLWGALGLRYLLLRLGVHYRLTNQRFFHERGILRRRTDRVEAIDIDDIAFEQGLIDRFFGTGRIKITSSDRSSPELWLEGIDDVKRVAALIDGARRAERLRRGVSVEAV